MEPQTVLWYVVGAVMVVGLMALIHSTFDAFLNVGAVAFARDVVGGLIEVDDTSQGTMVRQAVVSIAVLGTIVALWGDSLIGILLIGYTIWVPSLLAPFAWILVNPARRLEPSAFWAAVISGAVGWYVFEYQIQFFVPGILAGFILNLLALLLVQGFRQQSR